MIITLSTAWMVALLLSVLVEPLDPVHGEDRRWLFRWVLEVVWYRAKACVSLSLVKRPQPFNTARHTKYSSLRGFDLKLNFFYDMAMHLLCAFVIRIEVPKEYFQNIDSYPFKNMHFVYNGLFKICNIKFGQYCQIAEKPFKSWN